MVELEGHCLQAIKAVHHYVNGCFDSLISGQQSVIPLRETISILSGKYKKGPVKLIKQVKIAHSFLVCVKSVPHYHFKFSYVILQMAVKERFEPDF